MKKKGLSLSKRAALAERKERDAKRRVSVKDREMRRSNAIADGSMLWVTALASKIGPTVHITAEEFEAAKRTTYLARKNGDGSVDMALEVHMDGA